MSEAPAKLRKLAQRLLAIEDPPEKRGDTAVVFVVTEKLRQRLSILTGNAGFRAVLARALALAAAEVRWLNRIHIDARGSLEGLDEACAQISADEIARGQAALITQLIGLLATFIGASLTAYLLRDVWPEVSPDDLSSETEEDNG